MKDTNIIINYVSFHIKIDLEMKIYYWARDYSMRSLTKSHSRNTVFSSDIFVPNNYLLRKN